MAPEPRPTIAAWLALALVLGALDGCGGSSCNGRACAAPITLSGTVPDAGDGEYTVTFCKGAACSTASLALPGEYSTQLDQAGMSLQIVLAPLPPGGELSIAVKVLDAPSYPEGEAVSLAVHGPDGAGLLEGTTRAHYQTREEGSGDCTSCRWFRGEM